MRSLLAGHSYYDPGFEQLRFTASEIRSSLKTGHVFRRTLQEFGDNTSALIRVQRQEGNATCVAHADQVMKQRAGNGWSVKRQSGGSHRTLERMGWPDFVFAFHDDEEVGPRMPARIAKHTGLRPGDL